jgi:hypothetical protein
MNTEQKIKHLEEEIETLRTNMEILIRVASSLKMNGKSLFTMQLEKMIKERN